MTNDTYLILENISNNIEIKQNNKEWIFEGTFTVFDIVNENGRTYKEKEFTKHLPYLQELIKEKKLVGEFEHPSGFNINLDRISHLIEKLEIDSDNNRVFGRIKLLNTQMGKEAQALAEAGIPLHISSRASGRVLENGEVQINRLYTYDLVATPGFKQAQLNPVYESLSEDKKVEVNKILERFNTTETLDGWEYVAEQSNSQRKIYKKVINKESTTMDMGITVKSFNELKDNFATKFEELEVKLTKLQEENAELKTTNSILTKKIDTIVEYNDKEVVPTIEKIIEYNDKEVVPTIEKIIEYNDKEVVPTIEKIIEYNDKEVVPTIEKIIEYNDKEVVPVIEGLESYTSVYLKGNIEKLIAYQDHVYEELQKVPVLESLFKPDGDKITEGKVKEDDDDKKDKDDKKVDKDKKDDSKKSDKDDDDDDDDKEVDEKKSKTKKAVKETKTFSSYASSILEELNTIKNTVKNKVTDGDRLVQEENSDANKYQMLFEHCPLVLKTKYDKLDKKVQEAILRLSDTRVLDTDTKIVEFWNYQMANITNLKHEAILEVKQNGNDALDNLYGFDPSMLKFS